MTSRTTQAAKLSSLLLLLGMLAPTLALGQDAAAAAATPTLNSGDTAWMLTSTCLLYTSPSPRDRTRSRMPSSA